MAVAGSVPLPRSNARAGFGTPRWSRHVRGSAGKSAIHFSRSGTPGLGPAGPPSLGLGPGDPDPVWDPGPQAPRSVLFECVGTDLNRRREFDRAYSFSADALGRVLARDVTGASTRDLVLDAQLRTLLETSLGHYDCFNHHVRLDGGEALWFLRGTPATSHEHKRLCRVTRGLAVDEVLDWDGASSHHMEGVACWIGSDSVAIAYRVHDPNPSKTSAVVERRSLATGRTVWQHTLHLPPIAVCHIPPLEIVVWATLDGRVGALDARTGRTRDEATLDVDGVLTAPTCLDYAAGRLAVGTIDGRALVLGMDG